MRDAVKTLKWLQSQVGQNVMNQWRIGGVAKQTGLTVETLRYYEKLGLLSPPARTAQGYRLYDKRHLGELAFIRHCRALDMSLDDIASLQQAQRNPTDDCRRIDHLLAKHLDAVHARILALQSLEMQLRALSLQCDARGHSMRECGILRALKNN
jgi:DNA-binding transcriptional MerR regulator